LKEGPFFNLFPDAVDAEQRSIVRRQDMRHFLFGKDAAHDPQFRGKLVTLTQDLHANIAILIVLLDEIVLESRSIVVVSVDDEKLIRDALQPLEPAQPRPTGTVSPFRPVSTQVAPDRDVQRGSVAFPARALRHAHFRTQSIMAGALLRAAPDAREEATTLWCLTVAEHR
jgi:hypothetical protein